MIKIIKANISYLDQIYKIETDLFNSDAFSLQSLKSELENTNRLYLAALTKLGEVAAYVGASLAKPDCDIMKVAVSKNYQRQGIALKMLKKFLV